MNEQEKNEFNLDSAPGEYGDIPNGNEEPNGNDKDYPKEYNKPEEIKSYPDNGIGHKAKKVTKILTISAATLTACGFATTLLPGIISKASTSLSGEFQKVDPHETYCTFSIALKNEKKEEYKVYVHSDFVDREVDSLFQETEADIEGVVYGLNPGVSYSLKLRKDKMDIFSYTFRCDYPAVPKVKQVSYQSTADVDGFFSFTPDVEDTNLHYTDYVGMLKDKDGNCAYSSYFSGKDVNMVHTIPVNGSGLTGNVVTFTLQADSDIPTSQYPDADRGKPYSLLLFQAENVSL